MKNLSVFKNTNKNSDSQPDYRLVASYKDAAGNWHNETVASLWKGDTSNPNAPALTGKMSEAREYNGKQYPGWKIVPDGVATPNNAPDIGDIPTETVNSFDNIITEPQPPAPEDLPWL